MTGFYAWKQSFYNMGGEDGQIHYFESYESKLGGLTYNARTAEQPGSIEAVTNDIAMHG